jgi:hypothetical protein
MIQSKYTKTTISLSCGTTNQYLVTQEIKGEKDITPKSRPLLKLPKRRVIPIQRLFENLISPPLLNRIIPDAAVQWVL